MSITTIDDRYLTNIATAIRQKSGVEDTFKPSEMASAIKNISGGNPILQEVVVQPSINEQTITPSADYDGLSQVKIGAVTSSIDNDIKPENIKKGVEILGVVGNIEDKPAEPVLQNKSVEPSTGKQIITADSGYDGLGQVTVNEVTSKIDSNIKADNIKQGVSILGVQGTLEQGAEVVKKYKPKFISFRECPLSDVTEETRMVDTSLITNMGYMFYQTQIASLDLSGWDTSNVTDMQYMFNYSGQIKTLNISNFDTSKVTSMKYMFNNCNQLQELTLSNFSNNSLDDMENAFSYCSAIKNMTFSNFNTSNVTKMSNMFRNNNNLQSLDLSSFDTSNVTSMSSMFTQCKALEKLDIRNFTFGKVQYTNSMFSYIPVNCLIIVKSDTEKAKVLSIRTDLTNVKTLAEYQAEGGV